MTGRTWEGTTHVWTCPKLTPVQEAATATDVAPAPRFFTATPSYHLVLPDDPQLVDFLEQLLDEDLLSLVIEETNKIMQYDIYRLPTCMCRYMYTYVSRSLINTLHTDLRKETVTCTSCFHPYGRYADDKISKLEAARKLTRTSRYRRWSYLTLPELHGFLAIMLNMGTNTTERHYLWLKFRFFFLG